ncbi:MAG: hypothetical protein IT364_20105 [Candidatus Hydrogenedentes bacterium]|nr:hypothetical protein [Candidatus Hydrogenedentota bacterium]
MSTATHLKKRLICECITTAPAVAPLEWETPFALTSHYLCLRFTVLPDAGLTVTFRFPGVVKPGTLLHWTTCSPDESPLTVVALLFHLVHVDGAVLTRQRTKDDHCECPTKQPMRVSSWVFRSGETGRSYCMKTTYFGGWSNDDSKWITPMKAGRVAPLERDG